MQAIERQRVLAWARAALGAGLIDAGLAYAPEERQRDAWCPTCRCARTIILVVERRFGVSNPSSVARSRASRGELEDRLHDLEQPVRTLSAATSRK